MKFSKIFLFSLIASSAINLFAELKLPPVFSDEMVSQRQKPVKIVGTAEALADLKAAFAGHSKIADDDACGKCVDAKSAIKSKSSVWIAALDSRATPKGVRHLYKSLTKPDVCLYTANELPSCGFSKEIK